VLCCIRGITGDTALRLGHWFQTSAAFWLNLQSAYELRLTEQAAGAEIDALPVRPDQQAQPGLLSEAVWKRLEVLGFA
jgi:plasmid maintenance system antidote protein VapI